MPRYFLLLVTCLLLFLCIGVASATVKEDIDAGMPVAKVIEAALARGESIEDAVRQAMHAAPKRKREVLAAALQISPADAPRLTEIAIANGISPEEATSMGVKAAPDQAVDVVRMGIAADERKVADILRAAIRAGADPAQLTPLINEFVTGNMESLVEKDANTDPKRLLTTEEILSSLYDDKNEKGAIEGSDLPLLVLPPVNAGSDRLPSPN